MLPDVRGELSSPLQASNGRSGRYRMPDHLMLRQVRGPVRGKKRGIKPEWGGKRGYRSPRKIARRPIHAGFKPSFN